MLNSYGSIWQLGHKVVQDIFDGEVQEDLKKEEEEYIKDRLYKHFLPGILRGSTAGLAEWYKEKLAEGKING